MFKLNTVIRFTSLSLFIVIVACSLFSQPKPFSLTPLFTDNMILQQKEKVPVWGKGLPGVKIDINGSWGKKASTVVGNDSNWVAWIQTPKASGPFNLSIKYGDSLIVLNNVLIGEVWLCSGQSNMEMPLEGWPPNDTIGNSAYEIAHAQYPKIRLFHAQRNFSVMPTKQCEGKWEVCSASTVKSFSAVAYLFGKKIYTSLNVPIGLIEAAWGGTNIDAWMSKPKLSKFTEFQSTLNTIEASKDSILNVEKWLTALPSINVEALDLMHKWEGLQFDDQECSAKKFSDSAWSDMKLPTVWEKTEVGEFDGVIWFRKQIELPRTLIGKTLTLHLGPVDDMDETYVNGALVGHVLKEGYWKTERVYSIPDSLVRDSILQIAVRVIDYQGNGGIWGDGKKMYLSRDSSDTISIEGTWKYLPVAEYRSGVFSIFGGKNNQYKNRPRTPMNFSGYSATALYNGMINPLIPFTFRGVIWYQGENNVSNPELYKRTFPALIADWREAFAHGDFPFYYIQIAPYNYGPLSFSQSLREVQLQTLKVKNTGMVVTLDIGNPNNIHPANKIDVGDRLANCALAKTYGKKVTYSGPQYKSMKIQKGKIILSFDFTGKRLVIKERGGENNFIIAGKDSVFKKAVVKVIGKQLIVSSPEIAKPVAVRYAWSNTDEATLFNKEGLPASSFRTDIWKP
jgi:sialate O-acetylesterase